VIADREAVAAKASPPTRLVLLKPYYLENAKCAPSIHKQFLTGAKRSWRIFSVLTTGPVEQR
jgi:hypothetical protein